MTAAVAAAVIGAGAFLAREGDQPRSTEPTGPSSIGFTDRGGSASRTHPLSVDFFHRHSDTVVEGTVRAISEPYPAIEIEGSDPITANSVTVDIERDLGRTVDGARVEFVVLDNSIPVRVGERLLVISSHHRLGKLPDVNVPYIAARTTSSGWEFRDGAETLTFTRDEIAELGRAIARQPR